MEGLVTILAFQTTVESLDVNEVIPFDKHSGESVSACGYRTRKPQQTLPDQSSQIERTKTWNLTWVLSRQRMCSDSSQIGTTSS
jgi:hypothetical protein